MGIEYTPCKHSYDKNSLQYNTELEKVCEKPQSSFAGSLFVQKRRQKKVRKRTEREERRNEGKKREEWKNKGWKGKRRHEETGI